MNTNYVAVAAIALCFGAFVSPARAQQPWSALPGTCASTDNNFFYGTPSVDFPVARFKVPGGALTFNKFHDGYIAVLCSVDNPRTTTLTAFQRWNQLQVTYRDPDSTQQGTDGVGTVYQAYVELMRVSEATGAWSRIASFDSNLDCAGAPAYCQQDNTVKTYAVSFNHNFDFENYAYAVYGRLYRGIATWSLSPAIYQVRLQSVQVIQQSGLPPDTQ